MMDRSRQFGQMLQHHMANTYIVVERTGLCRLPFDVEAANRSGDHDLRDLRRKGTSTWADAMWRKVRGNCKMADKLAASRHFNPAALIASRLGSRDFDIARPSSLNQPVVA
ncbi:hypothetical protein Q4610_15625 [Sphingobium sp. HBC34]|uniref:Uncharacterized protein n=1 Tax=Sphingobium cyanobacteriorum TaxID=3063954 RepID=A0ABT8ZPM0_9SPHN|nr:hypothetical protein [Sphingobium sp. HBC34]MDO7836477.1 hypothetical protein [Sphingobium sp. HBC34]